MTDRPILFSSPMVRALLAGTKTQTRRTLNPQPHLIGANGSYIGKDGKGHKLRIEVGDRLWVRENAAICTQRWHHEDGHSYYISYRADENGSGQWLGVPRSGDRQHKGEPPYVFPKRSHNKNGSVRWQPSIHMPRWASRLTLTVIEVRVERLQDISESDAIAEGCGQYSSSTKLSRTFNPDWKGVYREGYAELWNEINGAGAWEANPWIVAYSFTVHHGNIDQIAQVAA